MKNRSRGRWMNSRGFNYVLFSSGDRKKRQKKEQARRVKRWQKAGRGQKAYCGGQKCPGKEGREKKATTARSPRPIVSEGECSHAWQMSLTIVSPAASSLPPALALEFHETASACESRSTRLVSRPAFPAATLAGCCGCIRKHLRWGWGYTTPEGLLVGCQKLSLIDSIVPTSRQFMRLHLQGRACERIHIHSLVDTEQSYIYMDQNETLHKSQRPLHEIWHSPTQKSMKSRWIAFVISRMVSQNSARILF